MTWSDPGISEQFLFACMLLLMFVVGIGVRYLNRNPHVLENIVLRLVAATVAVDDEGGSALLERAAQCIHADNGQRNGLQDARTAPPLAVGIAIWSGLSHGIFLTSERHKPIIRSRMRRAIDQTHRELVNNGLWGAKTPCRLAPGTNWANRTYYTCNVEFH
jgi:hypothetical protein